MESFFLIQSFRLIRVIRISALLFTMLLSLNYAFGQYQVDENCKEAWLLLMDLRIKEAKRLLDKELENNPANYYALYLKQTCDAYVLFINSDEDDYEDFLEDYETLRNVMDDKYIDSPYYLMCKSEMDIQVCYFRVIHGSVFGGIRKGYSGYREVYHNLDQYPDFLPSLKLDGFFNSSLSNLPPFIRSAIAVFGVSSDFYYGMKTLKSVYEMQKSLKGINAESALFILFAAKINKTPEMVYEFTQSFDKEGIGDLFLPKYFKANIEYRTGRNEQSLMTLSELHYENSQYAELIYNYMMGKVLLRKLDQNSGYFIEKYLENLKKEEYFKEMTYNLAVSFLLKGDKKKYNELCRIVREKGSDINERDREALYDASLDYEPEILLVKSRLLLDGRYIRRFEKVIQNYEKESRNELPYQLEYFFLKGRYYYLKNEKVKAITCFKKVLNMGQDEEYYFSCEAACYLGKIYEVEGDKNTAVMYYKKSVKLYKDKYYEYIGNLAEKALKRLK